MAPTFNSLRLTRHHARARWRPAEQAFTALAASACTQAATHRQRLASLPACLVAVADVDAQPKPRTRLPWIRLLSFRGLASTAQRYSYEDCGSRGTALPWRAACAAKMRPVREGLLRGRHRARHGPVSETLNVGAILPRPLASRNSIRLRGEIWHGRYKHVMSNVQFERLLSARAPPPSATWLRAL